MLVRLFFGFVLFCVWANAEVSSALRYNPSDVTFSIVTRRQQQPTLLDPSKLNRVKKKSTVISIAGAHETTVGPSSYFLNLTNALLEYEDYNVILVHADKLLDQFGGLSDLYTVDIGNSVANLIVALGNQDLIPSKGMHIVGHGLGAHIAGMAGKIVALKTSRKVYRITALEVSKSFICKLVSLNCINIPEFGGCFNNRLSQSGNVSWCLNSDDAEIVDVIHTDAGQLGVNKTIGTTDFWVNWGVAPQPGCTSSEFCRACSFIRSIWYYINTINGKKTTALKCDPFTRKILSSEEAWFGNNYLGNHRGNFCLTLKCENQKCTQ